MRSIKFPNMFSANSTNVWKADEYLQSTKQSTKLLLQTERGELFGDPYYGILLKYYLYSQNSYILRDLLADMVYTQLALFIPQLRINRQDIAVYKNKKLGEVICEFSGVNQIDYKVNTYQLTIYKDESI